jgi:hypothetical protein
MARCALETGRNVRFVNEAHMIRHPVDSHPVNRPLRRPRITDLLNLFLVTGITGSRDHGVAEHTLLNVWIPGRRGAGRRSVAERAFDTGCLHVDLVIKVNWLRRCSIERESQDTGGNDGNEGDQPCQQSRRAGNDRHIAHLDRKPWKELVQETRDRCDCSAQCEDREDQRDRGDGIKDPSHCKSAVW